MDKGNKAQTEGLSAALLRWEADEGSRSACTLPRALSYIPIGFGICWHVGFTVRCIAIFARASKLSHVIVSSLPSMVKHSKCR